MARFYPWFQYLHMILINIGSMILNSLRAGIPKIYLSRFNFQPINLALALEESNPKDGLVEDIGMINVGGWTLSNWDKKGNGHIDYPKVLQVSSNVGMVKIMQNLDLNLLGLAEKFRYK